MFNTFVEFLESSFQNFLCDISFPYRNSSKKLKPNVLSTWFTRYMECSKDSSSENFQNFWYYETNENFDYTQFCSENSALFSNMFNDVMFNLLIFRPNLNHIL